MWAFLHSTEQQLLACQKLEQGQWGLWRRLQCSCRTALLPGGSIRMVGRALQTRTHRAACMLQDLHLGQYPSTAHLHQQCPSLSSLP